VVLSEVDQKKSVKESQETAAEIKPGQFKKAPPPPKKVSIVFLTKTTVKYFCILNNYHYIFL
jgi:hypothetical protein